MFCVCVGGVGVGCGVCGVFNGGSKKILFVNILEAHAIKEVFSMCVVGVWFTHLLLHLHHRLKIRHTNFVLKLFGTDLPGEENSI